jgi:hypothetical protein
MAAIMEVTIAGMNPLLNAIFICMCCVIFLKMLSRKIITCLPASLRR